MRFPLFAAPLAPTLATVALCAASPTAFAADAAIRVTGAWSRPVPAGLPTGVVYLTVANLGDRPDRLVGAETPVAARTTLHRSTMAHGVMSMAAVPGGAEIPPKGALKLEPGGYHFMLEGLKGGLKLGARFPATLTFAHAGRVRIEVQVQAGSTAPAMNMTMR
jgi:copper(I)-binding protein